MRTPEPGSRTYLKPAGETTMALHPWGKAPVRVWEEKGAKPSDTPTRQIVRAAGHALYPQGKALARLRYFEIQRGLAPSIVAKVQVPLAAAARESALRERQRSPLSALRACRMPLRRQQKNGWNRRSMPP